MSRCQLDLTLPTTEWLNCFMMNMSFNDFALKKIMVKREMHTIAFPKEQED